VFLLPSGLRAVKNIELAIDGLSLLQQHDPQIRLLIIGPIIEEEYARAILNRIHKLPWITYLGEIPHSQMAGMLSLGDAVLNTSHSEGQPQTALEAMSLGKPCILTAVPGNINLVQTGREGFYISNANDLRQAGHILLTSPVLREEMGQNARRLIERRFTLARELDAYNQLYQEMVKNCAVPD
jgi:Glycosyltransferase